jgi:hypothetical protein
VNYARFHDRAEAIWAQIPLRFRDGAVLLVHRAPNPDPHNPGVFLLGMCEAAFAALEDALAWGGDVHLDERQSLIHLWYGSFSAMAERAVHFAWLDELEETILHELTHHWEHRAGLDGLDRFDAAQLLNFQRLRGAAVPRYYWRDGTPQGADRWAIDGDLFVEVPGAPPWTVLDSEGQCITCSPDPHDGWATIEAHGLPFDGLRGDLVVAPKPPERPNLWRRMRALFKKRDHR